MSNAHTTAPVAWYDVDDPFSPALDDLARKFGLHELQIEDCRHRRQRAKLEEHDHYIFAVLKHLTRNGETEFDEVDVFVSSEFLITVHQVSAAALIEKVRLRVNQGHVERLDKVFYLIVDTVVDEYIPMLDDLAEEISEVEAEVLKRPDPNVLSRIFRLKRTLIEFRRITGAMREVVNAIVRREGGFLGDDLDPYFRDVYDHLVRTVEMIETYRDLLTGSLDIYLSAVANRTNEVMKVLTIYGTIALPLVIITGFFGMNLKLPWMENPLGPLYAVGVMALSAVIVLFYFHAKRWF
ncbi:MAG: magnesium/cobalt transporter CorA [Terriglobales bacterium]